MGYVTAWCRAAWERIRKRRCDSQIWWLKQVFWWSTTERHWWCPSICSIHHTELTTCQIIRVFSSQEEAGLGKRNHKLLDVLRWLKLWFHRTNQTFKNLKLTLNHSNKPSWSPKLWWRQLEPLQTRNTNRTWCEWLGHEKNTSQRHPWVWHSPQLVCSVNVVNDFIAKWYYILGMLILFNWSHICSVPILTHSGYLTQSQASIRLQADTVQAYLWGWLCCFDGKNRHLGNGC